MMQKQDERGDSGLKGRSEGTLGSFPIKKSNRWVRIQGFMSTIVG